MKLAQALEQLPAHWRALAEVLGARGADLAICASDLEAALEAHPLVTAIAQLREQLAELKEGKDALVSENIRLRTELAESEEAENVMQDHVFAHRTLDEDMAGVGLSDWVDLGPIEVFFDDFDAWLVNNNDHLLPQSIKDFEYITFHARKALAAVARPSAATWRPIETAPKDGTRVLLSYSDREEDPRVLCASWTERNGGMWMDSFEGKFWKNPEWWFPVPDYFDEWFVNKDDNDANETY